MHGPQPPVLSALELLVTLHAENEVAPAAALHASLSAWLRASGQEARVLRGDAAARWSLLRELSALPATFPGSVRSAIGRAMLVGDLGYARTELGVVRRQQTATARSAAGALRSKAPLLATALADVLDPPPAPARTSVPPSPQRSGKGGWAIAALVIAALRVVLMLGRGTSSAPSYNPSFYKPPNLTMPAFSGFDGGLYVPSFDAGLDVPIGRLDELQSRMLRRATSTKGHAERVLLQDASPAGGPPRPAARGVPARRRRRRRGDGPGPPQRLRCGARGDEDAQGADPGQPDLHGRARRVEMETFERTLSAYCVELDRVRAAFGGSSADAGRDAQDAGRRGGTTQP